jgi:hypothetical protein
MEIYDELTTEAIDARARSERLRVLAAGLSSLGQVEAAKVARAWSRRQDSLANELEALRDFIVRVCRAEEGVGAQA